MPISTVTYKLIYEFRESGLLPSRPDILELGESNWYGDVPLDQLESDIKTLLKDSEQRRTLLARCQACREKLSAEEPILDALWDLSRIFYQAMLNYNSYTAIDLGGSPEALKLDLNHPIQLNNQYDIVIDFGTAEHVFNVYQLFKTVHEITKTGGIMIHALPFQGWVDHGFYNFHPTFYLDLAMANGYLVKLLLYWQDDASRGTPLTNREQVANMVKDGKFEGNGTLFAILQKSGNARDFQIPMQGYYANVVSSDVHRAWHENR